MTGWTTQSCIELQWVCPFMHLFHSLGKSLIKISQSCTSHHKLTYFQHAGWTAEWTATTKKIVWDKFDYNYHFRDEVTLATGLTDTNEAATVKNIFDNLSTFHMVMFGTLNELSHYLSTMLKDVKNKDALKWWYEHKHVYANLSWMALNYHTIPCKWDLISVSGT
jgi:hypothetical protein